jgi:predicted HTH domain antitoxin
MPKTKTLIRTNVMIDKELLNAIDEYAGALEEDRSTAIRQLIKRSLAEERIELAISKFRAGVTLRKAAEISGLDYREFQLELDRRAIPLTSSLSFARNRIKKVQK